MTVSIYDLFADVDAMKTVYSLNHWDCPDLYLLVTCALNTERERSKRLSMSTYTHFGGCVLSGHIYMPYKDLLHQTYVYNMTPQWIWPNAGLPTQGALMHFPLSCIPVCECSMFSTFCLERFYFFFLKTFPFLEK
jgi:hypothetical protein